MCPLPEFSLRDLPSRARLGPSISQHLPSSGAEPWQGEGAAYAEQMESIKTKGNGPDSIYYPSKGVRCISRHPQPYGKGEPSGATPVGRDRQGQHTDRSFTLLCPLAGPGASPGPSQPFIPLLGTLSLFLGTAPVPSHPLLRDDATEQPGHVEWWGDEEQGTDTCPKYLALDAAPPPWTLQALGIHGGGSSSRIQPTLPSELNLCLLFQECHSA